MACLVLDAPAAATAPPAASPSPSPTASPPAPKAWAALSQWLPAHSTDADYWWRATGTPLAAIMDAAGLSLESQYDALLSHYHWTIPYLRSAPRPDASRPWSSVLGAGPLGYCWTWNSPTTRPDVRVTRQALNRFGGTDADPLDQHASRELLGRLHAAMPSLDVSYVSPLAAWDQGLSRLAPDNACRAAVSAFVEGSPMGKLLSPFMMGTDHATAGQPRLKLYFQTPSTSFAAVREVMTLGGRIAVAETQLQALKSLVAAVTGAEDDQPLDYSHVDDDGAAKAPALLQGFVYSFDVAPGAALPHVQLYVVARHWGRDGLALARAVTGWMESRGRGQYCWSYLALVESLAAPQRPGEGKVVQSHIRCAFREDGELDVTSCLALEAAVPEGEAAAKKLVIPARATRRRGDSW